MKAGVLYRYQAVSCFDVGVRAFIGRNLRYDELYVRLELYILITKLQA